MSKTAEKPATGSTDLWQTLLRDTAAKTRMKDSNLFVLGDRCSGKGSLLKKLRFRAQADSTAEAPSHKFPEALSFSYFNLFDPDDADNDALDVPTKVNVWSMGDPRYAKLLQSAVPTADLDHSMIVIVLNLSKPHTILEELHRWLEVAEDTVKNAFSELPLAKQDELKARIQNAFDSKHAAIPASSDDAESKKDDEDSTSDVPAAASGTKVENNIGVPIVVVAAQSDFLLDDRSSNALTGDQCDFLQMHLRRVCLRFGASLCYTSTLRAGTNCTVLQKYLLRQLYPSQYTFVPKHEVIVRDAIFIPAGWDSERRIEDVVDEGSTVKKDARFNDVIKFPVKAEDASSTPAKASEPKVKAPDHQDFLKVLSTMEAESSSSGSTPQAEQESRKKKVAYLINQSKTKQASTPTGGAAALLARRGSTSTPKTGKAGSPARAAVGNGQDNKLLKNFFVGLMNRTDTHKRPPGAKDKKAPPKDGASKASAKDAATKAKAAKLLASRK